MWGYFLRPPAGEYRVCTNGVSALYHPNKLSLAVKNIQVNLIFLARLLQYLRKTSNILSLAVKNIQVNLIFLARLFVYLMKFDIEFVIIKLL